MLKLTPPGTLDTGTGALYSRATVYFEVLSPLFEIYLRVIQNPGEHFSLYGICAVVLVLRILTEILFSGLEVNRERFCCELYRRFGTLVGKNLNIENEIQNFTNNLKIGLKLPQALKRTLIGTAPLIASCST